MVWVKFQCLSLFSMPVLFGTRASSAWTFVSHFLQWIVHSVSPQMSIVNCCFWAFCVCAERGAMRLMVMSTARMRNPNYWSLASGIHPWATSLVMRKASPSLVLISRRYFPHSQACSCALGVSPMCWKTGHSKTQWSKVHINFILHPCCSWVPWHWDQYACFVNCEHCKEILLHVHAAFVKKWWTFCQSCKHALFFMLVWILAT